MSYGIIPQAITCGSDPIVIDRSETLTDPDWDAFLCALPGAHYEQTSLWAKFRSNYGWRPVRWVVRQQGRIVGGLQILIHRVSRFGNVAYAIRGPLCEEGRTDIEELLVDQATAYGCEKRFIYQIFDLPYDGKNLATALDDRGYRFHPRFVPPTGLITATLILDLQPSLDSLMKNMRKSVRQDIRAGEKAGFAFEEGGTEHLEVLWDLMATICRRRGSTPTPASAEVFKKLWEIVEPSGLIRLFLVRLDQEIVTAALAFGMADTLRVWKVGWSGTHQEKHPNHFRWWSIIQWAKAHGFKYVDFVWINDHDARLLSTGQTRPEAFEDGTTLFKTGFGGRLVLIPAARSQFFHPVFQLFAKDSYIGFIESKAARTLLRRLWN